MPKAHNPRQRNRYFSPTFSKDQYDGYWKHIKDIPVTKETKEIAILMARMAALDPSIDIPEKGEIADSVKTFVTVRPTWARQERK